ncbi:MAG: hypothetical protein ACLTXH_14980 [Enterobacter hormaechei]
MLTAPGAVRCRADYAREGVYRHHTSISEPINAASAIVMAREVQVPFNWLTLSSAATAASRNLMKRQSGWYGRGGFESLPETLQQLVSRHQLPLGRRFLR